MWPNPQETFTEEILNGKLHFVCSVCCFSDENPTYAKFSDELIFFTPFLHTCAYQVVVKNVSLQNIMRTH